MTHELNNFSAVKLFFIYYILVNPQNLSTKLFLVVVVRSWSGQNIKNKKIKLHWT